MYLICFNSNGNVFLFKFGEEFFVMGSFIEVVFLIWGVKMGMNFRDIKYKN